MAESSVNIVAGSTKSDDHDASKQASSYPDWMGNISSELQGVSLNCLAIPGSHDSFSSSLSVNSDLTPDVPPAIRAAAKLFGTGVKEIVRKWSMTQSLSFTAQLTAGIRYFDLRIGCTPCSEEFFFMHGLHAGNVEHHLEDIKTFLHSHTKEVILLDFNHFYNFSEFQHKQCLAMLIEVLGSLMCPFVDVDSVTLDMMWQNNLQVIVFYNSELVSEYLQFWPGKYIPSPWANTSDVKRLIGFLEINYAKGRSKETFYVTQGILTPDEGYVLQNILGSLKDCLCSKVAPEFVKWLRAKKSGIQGLNICLMDFAEMDSYIPVVLALNAA